MTYRVTIYCPDRHIVYDGRTPAEKGVGGGITARVRMSEALARHGHTVTMVVNCPRREQIAGVEYVPLDEAERLDGDVLVLTTSGDKLDLTPAIVMRREARLTVIWVHGPMKPGGIDGLRWDSCYAVSNFVGDIAREQWGIPAERIFVSYNAFDESAFARAERRRVARDPYRLVYFSHPSKGVEAALDILTRLRSVDRPFHLRIFGGERLWGGEGTPRDLPDGASFGGLVGQDALAAELLQAGFALQMQAREEPGALAIMEAFRGGCLIVASPVGCYPEMIADGRNGLMIAGDHTDSTVRDEAARRILELAENPPAMGAIRAEAMAAPWSSDRMAEVWEAHWDWKLQRPPSRESMSSEPCPRCGGGRLKLADGDHCLVCALYQPLKVEDRAVRVKAA